MMKKFNKEIQQNAGMMKKFVILFKGHLLGLSDNSILVIPLPKRYP